MREIKFRGRSVKGDWKYGWLKKDLPNSTAYYDTHPYRILWYPESGGSANCPVETETIGQYIGIQDRNGTEIYEGDIINVYDWGGMNGKNILLGQTEVVWDVDDLGFRYKDSTLTEDVYDQFRNVEVIDEN